MRKFGRGQTIKVGDLFEVYRKKLKAPQKTVIQEFIEVVEDFLGVSIPQNRCHYSPSTRTISLTISGAGKSEVLLNKQEILTHLKGRMGERNAPKEII